MDFSTALLHLKEGKPIARRLWGDDRRLRITWHAERVGVLYVESGYGSMTRWRPTDDDLLADDWSVVEAPPGSPRPGWSSRS